MKDERHYELPYIDETSYTFNVDLSNYNFFKSGGKADIMFFPKDVDELIFFLQNFDQKDKIFVIGAGSNLLVRDSGFKGVVVNLRNLNKIKRKEDKIVCECGAVNGLLFNFAKSHGIADYDFLGLIPGTVGGACRMNAGCYGHEISDILAYIAAVDFDGNIKIFNKGEFELGYRYNSLPENLIFINAGFEILRLDTKENILMDLSTKLSKKFETQPINEKTCGSTFKNLPNYPAWKIVQELGFQGKDFNGVKMSEKHANFLINDHGTSTDIENLIKMIVDKAKKEKNIDLELELKILG